MFCLLRNEVTGESDNISAMLMIYSELVFQNTYRLSHNIEQHIIIPWQREPVDEGWTDIWFDKTDVSQLDGTVRGGCQG